MKKRKNDFTFLLKLIRKHNKGKIFLCYFILAYLLDNLIYCLSLTCFKTNVKKKVYKKYLRYRLRKHK